MRALLLCVVLLCFNSGASAQSAENLAAVERAGAVGWELYQHDQAAWHGTDAMLAEIANPSGEGLAGWITERTPQGVALIFVREDGADLFAAYRSLYRDGEVRETGRESRRLTETEARLFRARSLAVAAMPDGRCAPTYNSVVLPRAERGADGVDVDVYLMPASENMRQIPLGGHYRLGVDSEVGVVREMARFTNGCITLDAGGGAAALMITQLIGDTPTEVHVFESLTVGLPIYVSARSGLWAVEGRNIRFQQAAPAQR